MSTVTSYSVGNGDMFYINHGSDSFTIIDCCLPDDDREAILKDIQRARRGKGVVRFVSTHPDEDHLVGLKDLDEELGLTNFYCIKNEITKEDESEDFKHYCALRDSDKTFFIYQGVTRKWLNVTNDERGSAGIRVLWPNTDNEDYKEALAAAEEGESPNNVSAILTYQTGEVTFMWMGDLETDLMEKIVDEIKWPKVHILFAPHHGRYSGRVPHAILDKIKPRIIVIGEAPSRHLHYYGGYDKLTQNSAGEITFECDGSKVHIFASQNTYEVSHLDDEGMSSSEGTYIGTLNV
jgi:beta-lactamase superfamily II metal-dependent hydrolase